MLNEKKGEECLSESTQNALYCAMLRLACYDDDFGKNRIGNPAAACAVCRIGWGNCNNFYNDDIVNLAASVGIILSPCIKHEDYQVHLYKQDICLN